MMFFILDAYDSPLKIKVLGFIRLILASHIVPQIRYLGFTLEGRRVP
jgi:hypothetical protein